MCNQKIELKQIFALQESPNASQFSPAQYTLPPVTMLEKDGDVRRESTGAIAVARETLQKTLDDLHIPGTISGYVFGPRVIRFEVVLEAGYNVQNLENIQEIIEKNFNVKSVRIIALPESGNMVGVEIPVKDPRAVFMRTVMESDAWLSGKYEIPVVLGENVSGNSMVFDLAQAPHLLISGATGTGQSVCMNTLIMSLLFRFSPENLKLILVDLKIVEFTYFESLPHLLTPLIGDADKAQIALRWTIREMKRRYCILAETGAKNVQEYNRLNSKEHLPYLVFIIDDLGDLMFRETKKDTEKAITILAQKGHTVGIHIIVATQRPSVSVITPVVKATLPARFCFRVHRRCDSHVVLHTDGAEKLLGMGDMLCVAPNNGMNMERIQVAWVKDDDIKSIVDYISAQAPQCFNESLASEMAKIDDMYEMTDVEDREICDRLLRKYLSPEDGNLMRDAIVKLFLDHQFSSRDLQHSLGTDYDETLKLIEQLEMRGFITRKGHPAAKEENNKEVFEPIEESQRESIAPLIEKYLRPGDNENMRLALEIVILLRKPSISYLQRRLCIGFNQAAAIIEELEKRGIVGPASEHGCNRMILIDSPQNRME